MNKQKLNKEEAKQMILQVLNKLKEQGFAQEVGVLDMSNEDQIKRSRSAIDKLEKIGLPKEIIDKLRGKMDEVENKKCRCSDCFNFNTFETVLRDDAKKFDYATVQFNGKNFDIKYCESNDGEEYFMISDGYVDVPKNLTIEELQQLLSEAVKDKNFEAAQAYLNTINELKNKE